MSVDRAGVGRIIIRNLILTMKMVLTAYFVIDGMPCHIADVKHHRSYDRHIAVSAAEAFSVYLRAGISVLELHQAPRIRSTGARTRSDGCAYLSMKSFPVLSQQANHNSLTVAKITMMDRFSHLPIAPSLSWKTETRPHFGRDLICGTSSERTKAVR